MILKFLWDPFFPQKIWSSDGNSSNIFPIFSPWPSLLEPPAGGALCRVGGAVRGARSTRPRSGPKDVPWPVETRPGTPNFFAFFSIELLKYSLKYPKSNWHLKKTIDYWYIYIYMLWTFPKSLLISHQHHGIWSHSLFCPPCFRETCERRHSQHWK